MIVLRTTDSRCPHGEANRKCAAAWKVVAAHDMNLRVRHGTVMRDEAELVLQGLENQHSGKQE